MGTIAVLTRGLWRLRHEVAVLTGMSPVRWTGLARPRFDAVAGWGHRPTAAAARRLAARDGVPYVALEDGPLRSVRPGPAEPPTSMVADRAGIYYDAAGPSDLTALLADQSWLTPEMMARAEAAAGMLRSLRLSKYNSGPERTPDALGLSPGAGRRVLVLDQVRSDASIPGALADEASFQAMLADALADTSSAEIVVKLHPDVLSGRRAGYLTEVKADARVRIAAEPVNPWSLLDAVDTVYTVSSGLGFEAAAAGKRVVTFGSPFYAGWGFTDDRRLRVSRSCAATATALFAAYHLRYTRYFDAYTREEIGFEEAADQLAWRRDRFMRQGARVVCWRIPRWKRRPVDAMLDGPAGPPLHVSAVPDAVARAKAAGGPVVAWASRDHAGLAERCAAEGVALLEAEDGFIRSAGLGASFVLPSSLAFDSRGIFYDATRPSDLEALLQEADIPEALMARAARLRERLVARGTTKYNVAAARPVRFAPGGRPVVLVPGQVEDDASILSGSPVVKTNLALLEAVRARHPHAFIVYKPHPDVEAGYRRGRVPAERASALADAVVAQGAILDLIAAADRIETMTSLAGFEALIRGKPVTTHGQPFYASWGLTEDLCPVARRTRRRSLDEVVAAALILYPRYVDPMSGLPCEPELLVERLADGGAQALSPSARMVRLGQSAAARGLHVVRMLRARRGG